MALTISNNALLSALNNLTKINTQLELSNIRLTTGKRINSAADDPSGIVTTSRYRSQIARIEGQVANGEKINAAVEAADGALEEITGLVDEIETAVLAASSGSATAAQKLAYQSEIDLAIQAIDNLVATTTFNGTTLLDGSIAYSTSGVTATDITDLRINSVSNTSATFNAAVSVNAAEKASISYSNGNLTDDVTFTLTGTDGDETFNFTNGTTIATIASTVTAESATTGVEAVVDGGTLTFRTLEGAAAETVSINVTAGTFVMDGAVTSDTGLDAVVTLNSTSTTVDAHDVTFNVGGVAGSFVLTETLEQNGGTTNFSVSGTGANWRIDAGSYGAIDYGLSGLASTALGNGTLGYLSTLNSGGTNDIDSGNFTAANNIVDEAADRIALERGRIGAVKAYAVTSTLNSLNATKTALTDAVSNIEDIDYALETANKSRLEVMMQVGTAVIASITQNQNNILTLLGLT